MKTRTRKTASLITIGLVGALALAGCSGSEEDPDSKGKIVLGYLPAWTDGLSMAYLVDDQLQKMGYEVEHMTFADNGPMFAGLANGDFDMYPSTWPEINQKEYVEEYADDLEDLGAWSDSARTTLSVPEYSDIDSIDELLANADDFDGKVYTVEPGAGTTKNAEENLFPTYGLDEKFELVTSSTAGMLGQLERALSRDEDVVITMWRPFWPYTEYPIKDLEDPKGAMGEPQTMNFFAHKGFAEEFPEAAELVEKIKLDDDQYASLENTVVNEYEEGEEAEAIDAWLKENGDQFDWVVE